MKPSPNGAKSHNTRAAPCGGEITQHTGSALWWHNPTQTQKSKTRSIAQTPTAVEIKTKNSKLKTQN